jgi:hypothetical protein
LLVSQFATRGLRRGLHSCAASRLKRGRYSTANENLVLAHTLEAAPFQDGLQTAFFRKLLKTFLSE